MRVELLLSVKFYCISRSRNCGSFDGVFYLINAPAGYDAPRVGHLKGEEIPRLWRGGSSSLTFAGVVPGLCFSHLPLEIGPQHEFEAPSLRDSGGILADPSPPLKRWANHHCAYGAGEFALAALLLQQCTHAGPFEGPQTIRPSALPGGIYCPGDSERAIGTTEVVPCYKASRSSYLFSFSAASEVAH